MTSWRNLALLTLALVAARIGVYALIAHPFGGLASAMCQYDCGWYVRLAADGYQSDSQWDTLGPVPNWAFFPLYPILLRIVTLLSQLRGEAAGLILSNLLFVGFVLASAVYLRRTRPGLNLVFWALFAVLFPFGFTFSAVYTEGLFALLTIAVLLALQDRRLLLAGLLTALLCATRPTGVLMIPIVLAHCANLAWQARATPDRLGVLGKALLPLAIAPLGLSLFMLYQFIVIGDAMAFNHVQLLWGREWVGPIANLTRAFTDWDWQRMTTIHGDASRSYAASWALIGLLVAGVLAWQRRWAEAYLLAASVLLPLSTAMHSLPRFVATNPFFLFACCAGLLHIRGPRLRVAAFGGIAALQAVVLVGWYAASNALY